MIARGMSCDGDRFGNWFGCDAKRRGYLAAGGELLRLWVMGGSCAGYWHGDLPAAVAADDCIGAICDLDHGLCSFGCASSDAYFLLEFWERWRRARGAVACGCALEFCNCRDLADRFAGARGQPRDECGAAARCLEESRASGGMR